MIVALFANLPFPPSGETILGTPLPPASPAADYDATTTATTSGPTSGQCSGTKLFESPLPDRNQFIIIAAKYGASLINCGDYYARTGYWTPTK